MMQFWQRIATTRGGGERVFFRDVARRLVDWVVPRAVRWLSTTQGVATFLSGP